MADHAGVAIGQHLGNYRVIRLLGQGGFSSVYLAEHLHLGTLAAIKVLRTQLMSDEGETFRHEARTIARLEHLTWPLSKCRAIQALPATSMPWASSSMNG